MSSPSPSQLFPLQPLPIEASSHLPGQLIYPAAAAASAAFLLSYLNPASPAFQCRPRPSRSQKNLQALNTRLGLAVPPLLDYPDHIWCLGGSNEEAGGWPPVSSVPSLTAALCSACSFSLLPLIVLGPQHHSLPSLKTGDLHWQQDSTHLSYSLNLQTLLVAQIKGMPHWNLLPLT